MKIIIRDETIFDKVVLGDFGLFGSSFGGFARNPFVVK